LEERSSVREDQYYQLDRDQKRDSSTADKYRSQLPPQSSMLKYSVRESQQMLLTVGAYVHEIFSLRTLPSSVHILRTMQRKISSNYLTNLHLHDTHLMLRNSPHT